jgi:hypothetical protein
MGMYLALANVTDATIERLLADPPLVWQILEPDDPSAVAAARERPPGPGFFGRLLGRKAPPPHPPRRRSSCSPGRAISARTATSRSPGRTSTTCSRAPRGR